MNVYAEAIRFKARYPMTVAWRIKKHCQRLEEHLNDGEEVKYVFVGQRNDKWHDIFSTGVFAITNKRLMISSDRLIYGYYFYSITPEMFNDLSVYSGLIWGKIVIDTVKEEVYFTNLDKKSLDEIETQVTDNLMKDNEGRKKGL